MKKYIDPTAFESGKIKELSQSALDTHKPKVAIDSIPVKSKTMNVLIVEPPNITSETKVLLFLHGKREASENDLKLVCLHNSPPFQAIQARQQQLKDVIVVAPQCPEDLKINEKWNWRDYAKDIAKYLKTNFSQQECFAVGFSRGGLGVLQLLHQSPTLISKWAVVDPQSTNEEEKNKLFDLIKVAGWLRYTNQHDPIKAFSSELSKHKLVSDNSCSCELNDVEKNVRHVELAKRTFNGDTLGGDRNLYTFFGLGDEK